jgi:hydrogenase expression/formation protein HypE
MEGEAEERVRDSAPHCPIPRQDNERITMAHGAGGRAMGRLIDDVFVAVFSACGLQAQLDAAILEMGVSRLAFTTDAFVVKPLRFPGGDIGSLAVYGTANDLAMQGARPVWISAAFIIEEGFPIHELREFVASMRQAAERIEISIVAGDTKVVERGKADGLYVTTAGIGIIERPVALGPTYVREGDIVILNGDLGRHGVAVMSAREELGLKTDVESDLAPLSEATQVLLAANVGIHCMRDLTRGGLASALNEIAQDASCRILLDEAAIPVSEPVRGACELLGLDPSYVANEGRFVLFVSPEESGRALSLLRTTLHGKDACVIGRVFASSRPQVAAKTILGVERILDMLTGEQLPRIC